MTLPALALELARKHRLRFSAEGAYLKLRLSGHPPLHVERFGKRLVVVGHSFSMTGELFRQPEFTFLIDTDGWRPVSFRFGGTVHECLELDDEERVIGVDAANELIVRQAAEAFARVLVEDGWLERSRAVVVQPALVMPTVN